jgi:hypothetical protein
MNKELQFLLYNTPQENVKIDVVVKDETMWLTQKAMAALFDVQMPAISKHIKNIFEEGELDEKMVVSILEITTQHGAIADKTQTKETNFYNLDAIISVGYRRHCGLDPQSPEIFGDSCFRRNGEAAYYDNVKRRTAA